MLSLSILKHVSFLAFLFVYAMAQKHYLYQLDVGTSICPGENFTCGVDNRRSFLCSKERQVSERCDCFRPMKFNSEIIDQFVIGHNGLRNREAKKLKIANMNLVYWSEHLAEMASRFCYECQIGEMDPSCLIIGTKQLNVGQNFLFVDRNLFRGWAVRAMRAWYGETYKVRPPDLNVFYNEWLNGTVRNYTQIAWPKQEFFGCGGTKFNHGYLLSCMYYPPFRQDTYIKSHRIGEKCSNCSKTRRVCSKEFDHLCGVDADQAAILKYPLGLLLMLFVVTIFATLPV